MRPCHRVLPIALLLLAPFSRVSTAVAVRLPGGGSARTDCYSHFEVDGIPAATSVRVADCLEGDPACDHDGACNDSCRFRVALCLNQPGNAPTCIPPFPPSALREVKTRRAAAALVVPALDSSACGAFLDIDVPVRTRRGGRVKRPGKVKLPVVAISPVRPRRDRDRAKLVCLPRSNQTPCPTTTTTTALTTTTTTTRVCGNGQLEQGEACDPPGLQAQCGAGETCLADCRCGSCPTPCAPTRIVTSTDAGRLVVDSLNAFPFPAGVMTTIDAGAADGACRHPAIVPGGGFDVPTFCIQGLGYTSDVFPLGCAEGTALGNGGVWDAASQCADADIFRQGDTSDGTCNLPGQPCNSCFGAEPGRPECTGTPGAAANTLGDIDATRGDGSCDPPGVHTQLDIPVRSLTWSDNDGTPDCPDEDGVFDGMDQIITDFNFILSPTTAQTRAEFVDKNGDGCSFAGGGPASTRVCSNDPSLPCAFANDCVGEATCGAGTLAGVPATGPCCTVGQTSLVVATGNAFSGAGPLFDLIFMNRSPTIIQACEPPGALESCTLTTDACRD
jgi:hypothetical protein